MRHAINLGPSHCLVHIAWLAVVGCDSKHPVAIGVVEFLQIGSSGIACLHWVAALVDERVHLKAMPLGSEHHEVPQATGASRRHGISIECRPRQWNTPQGPGQPPAAYRPVKIGHIEGAHPQHLSHESALALQVILNVLLHDGVESHLHPHLSRQAVETVAVHIVGCEHIAVVIVNNGKVLEIPVGSHRPAASLETGGIDDVVVIDRFLNRQRVAGILRYSTKCRTHYHCRY